MIAAEARDALLLNDGIKLIASEPDPSNRSIPELFEAFRPDAVILRKGRIDAHAIAAAPNLEVIAKHGVGVDTVDVAAASAAGIAVMVTTGANATAVAEHALTLTLCALKQITTLNRRLSEGHWDKASHRGLELSGKRVGLIGYGRIGQEFARLLKTFHVEITAFVPNPRPPHPRFHHVQLTEDLDQLLRSNDIVSLHCPLTVETRHLLGEYEFAKMQAGTMVINTARGGLIDEAALLKALQTGQVGAAGLDCLAEEPPSIPHALLDHPGVVATPHIAWATHETSRQMGLMAVNNVMSVLSRRKIPAANTVNYNQLIPKVDRATSP